MTRWLFAYANHRLFRVQNVLISLNLRDFRAEDWGIFVADAGVALLTEGRPVVPNLVQAWMKNPEFSACTNLAWFSADRPTLLLVASPFPDRPCGRPLPDINTTCRCGQADARPRRKRWNVKHDCRDGMSVDEVELTVTCSGCKRQWYLPRNRMVGVLCEVNGLFSVVAPFFP
jgi:hypothetical protein